MKIQNAKFEEINSTENSFYIYTLGFEERSYYLLDKLKHKLTPNNSMVFILGDYKNHEHLTKKNDDIVDYGLKVEYINYSDLEKFSKCISNFISECIMNINSVNIHVDYSSMPKSWYCRLPSLINQQLEIKYSIYFWYSEGNYPIGYDSYPSAGIDSFIHFSGKPSLVIDERRTHIIALGFDVKRSTAITTLLDPEDVINCYSYNPNRAGFEISLEEINASLLSRASLILKFDINNFSLLFSKLNETVNEILPNEVIIIPDGPKPLIFAMSLVASYREKEGVTCLHVSRNPDMFKLMDVTPTGNIIGFKLTDL